MEVDLGMQFSFPGEISSTSCSTVGHGNRGNRGNYSMTAECRESGRRARLFPVEVGTGGQVGSSTARLMEQ